MAVMEFHYANLINTTSLLAVDAGQTGTVQYLIDNNRKLAFSTSGYNSTTATTITLTFSPARIISHIMLMNHNLKNFSVTINTSTNSVFSSTTNSATSTYIGFSSQTAGTVVFTLTDTIPGSREKSVGELVVTERRYVFERNPPIEGFRYATDRKQVKHAMPDGGTVLFNIRDKYETSLKLEHFSQTSYDAIKSIYDDALPVMFVPFPTSTGWDGGGFECVWPGRFDFRYSTNTKGNGYTGTINLEETPAG